ncbi:DUF1801 domain-containing protein [Fodinibius halophilus]|uniref:DUF1801 domain-containing protein n=1 Tax=Fodinibius halophilus TaxID=1736908 RepID=A0A6M1TNP5_9BACT|nr:DUF1801 domain-containing protein [Fodinibius halophilus]NGP89940.1 DUF1801 domain-containing protein [Fodinibius halophilus]
MENLIIETTPDVESAFNKYPASARKKMVALRSLIIETANETEQVPTLEETLKWGEPSYIAKHGSTVRIDWKKKTPDQYAIYFTCSTELVPTFKRLYSDVFEFEGDRAIIFHMDEEIPKVVLKKCIAAALMYHKVKQLPTLGL